MPLPHTVQIPCKVYKLRNTELPTLTRESHISHNISLPGLDRGHLLEEVLASNETEGGQEGNDGNANTIVASVAVLIVETHILTLLVLGPPL